MAGILLAVFFLAIFIFLIRKLSFFHVEGISKNAFTFVFIVKIITGIAFWALYTYYSRYQNKADAFLYFDDGKVLYSALFKNPLNYLKLMLGVDDPSLQHYIDQTGYWTRSFNQGMYDETRTIIRFNALTCLFSFGNYHVHTVFMCFLSFTGLVGIFKTFLPYLKDKKTELFLFTFFLPSVLFWSSGVLKEGLIVFSMGMTIYFWFKITREGFSIRRLVLIIIFLLLLAMTKIYMLLIILPALIAHAWIAKTSTKFSLLKYLTVIIIYISIGLSLPKFNFPFMLFEKQRQSIYLSRGGAYLVNENQWKFIYIKSDIPDRIVPMENKPGFCKIKPGVPYMNWTRDNYLDTGKVNFSTDTTTYWVYYNQEAAGSKIDIPILFPSIRSLLKISPQAFLVSLLRPHLLEAKNALMFFSAIENFFVLLFIFLCCFFYKKNSENFHLVFFCLTIVILLFTLVGITTAILGSTVRYKIPALPFLFIALLIVLDKEKLLNKLSFLKRFLA